MRALRVLEEVEDPLLLHQPRHEGEIGLGVLHAVGRASRSCPRARPGARRRRPPSTSSRISGTLFSWKIRLRTTRPRSQSRGTIVTRSRREASPVPAPLVPGADLAHEAVEVARRAVAELREEVRRLADERVVLDDHVGGHRDGDLDLVERREPLVGVEREDLQLARPRAARARARARFDLPAVPPARSPSSPPWAGVRAAGCNHSLPTAATAPSRSPLLLGAAHGPPVRSRTRPASPSSRCSSPTPTHGRCSCPSVKATYDLGKGGPHARRGAAPPVARGRESGATPRRSSYRYEPECAFFKPATDVALVGSACAPRVGATEVLVALQVGALRTGVRVVGDRAFYRSMGSVGMTRPVRRSSGFRLQWERAFGGWDRSHAGRGTAQLRAPQPGGRRLPRPGARLRGGPALPEPRGPGAAVPRLGRSPDPGRGRLHLAELGAAPPLGGNL